MGIKKAKEMNFIKIVKNKLWIPYRKREINEF